MARLVRGLATNPEDKSSIPWTDVAREAQSLQVVLWYHKTHIGQVMNMKHTHHHN